ncbi:hypothetical protein DMUE_1216 [Dictyocoela muelleri]|nr:hypothetical protein DMUE_1216 [Dictyocoela muelleri]
MPLIQIQKIIIKKTLWRILGSRNFGGNLREGGEFGNRLCIKQLKEILIHFTISEQKQNIKFQKMSYTGMIKKIHTITIVLKVLKNIEFSGYNKILRRYIILINTIQRKFENFNF